jgi:hypothetical protein
LVAIDYLETVDPDDPVALDAGVDANVAAQVSAHPVPLDEIRIDPVLALIESREPDTFHIARLTPMNGEEQSLQAGLHRLQRCLLSRPGGT